MSKPKLTATGRPVEFIPWMVTVAQGQADERDRMMSEIDTLRAALGRIASEKLSAPHMANIAKKALR